MTRHIPYTVAEYTVTITLADLTTITINSPFGEARNEAIGIIISMTEAGLWEQPILINGQGPRPK